MSEWFPPLIHWQRDALNGHYPSSIFYSKAVEAENHITGYRDRSVFRRAWLLGNAAYGYTGTTNVARFRFRSRYGAKYLRMTMLILKSIGGGATPDPSIDVDVTEVGVGTISTRFAAVAEVVSGDDKPSDWRIATAVIALTPNAVHTVLIDLNDYARLGSCEFHEVGNATVSESTNYYNSLVPQAGTQILDTTRSRLLIGLSNMWSANAGTIVHFGKIDGSATTRTSATLLNLIDGTSTGAPSAASAGWHLDLSYHASHSTPTTVAFEFSAYASVAGGSAGLVKLLNAAGTVLGTITVTGGAAWYTTTLLLSTTAQKYDVQIAGDGVNALSVYACSLQEWESR